MPPISLVRSILINFVVPSSTKKEQKRKMSALSKARTIWSKTAHRSKEAAHATRILNEILAQVSQPATSGPSARPVVDEPSAASAAETTASSSSRDNAHSTEPVLESEGSLPQPNWSAVNANLPSEKAPSKSYSVEWSYEWLDNLGKRKDHAPNGALGSLLTNGVDWVSRSSWFPFRVQFSKCFPLFPLLTHKDTSRNVSTRSSWTESTPQASMRQPWTAIAVNECPGKVGRTCRTRSQMATTSQVLPTSAHGEDLLQVPRWLVLGGLLLLDSSKEISGGLPGHLVL